MDFRKMDGNDLVSEKTVTNLIKLRRFDHRKFVHSKNPTEWKVRLIEWFGQPKNSWNRKFRTIPKFGQSKNSNGRKFREIEIFEQPKNSEIQNFRVTTKFGQTFSLLTFFIFPWSISSCSFEIIELFVNSDVSRSLLSKSFSLPSHLGAYAYLLFSITWAIKWDASSRWSFDPKSSGRRIPLYT